MNSKQYEKPNLELEEFEVIETAGLSNDGTDLPDDEFGNN